MQLIFFHNFVVFILLLLKLLIKIAVPRNSSLNSWNFVVYGKQTLTESVNNDNHDDQRSFRLHILRLLRECQKKVPSSWRNRNEPERGEVRRRGKTECVFAGLAKRARLCRSAPSVHQNSLRQSKSTYAAM